MSTHEPNAISSDAAAEGGTCLTRSPNYKYWVFSALAIGIFASVVDHGSVNVALPTIASHFQTDLPTIQWVVIIYALTIAALLLPMGRLSDLVGRKKIYIFGIMMLCIGAALSGLSTSLGCCSRPASCREWEQP